MSQEEKYFLNFCGVSVSVYALGKMGELKNVFLAENLSKILTFERHGLGECETYLNNQSNKIKTLVHYKWMARSVSLNIYFLTASLSGSMIPVH